MWRRVLLLAASGTVFLAVAAKSCRDRSRSSADRSPRISAPSPQLAGLHNDLEPDTRPVRRTLEEIRVKNNDPTEARTLALVENLKDDDRVVVAEAANALVARRATSAIRALAEMDIHRPDGIAPGIIDALGRLGGMASGDARRTAVDRLLALMHSEKLRDAADSAGNLLQLYEALGATEDDRAAAPLETELQDPSVGIAPKVVIVQALAEIGATSSRPVVLRVRASVAASAGRDAFEAELRKDLLAAIDTALTTLP